MFDVTILEDFDEISGEEIEAARKALGLSSEDFADNLGWSKRKYQRLLEAAADDGNVPRETALAIYGLVTFLGGEEVSPPTFSGEATPKLFVEIAGTDDTWSVRIAPFLMQGLIQRAKSRQTTTYGAEAERLEDAGKTGRVWPRTAYAHPLGLICDVCDEIKEIKGTAVPLLTSIVAAQSGEPGAGFDGMVQRHLKNHLGSSYLPTWRSFKQNRGDRIKDMQKAVFDFPYWDEVLRRAGISV